MRILIVDDEELAVTGLKHIVRKLNRDAEIITFTNPVEALGYVKKTPVNIAFLDIEMPVMNGVSFAREMKLYCPRVNIIFATDCDSYYKEAVELRASGYIMKPIQPEKVSEELNNLRNPVENTGRAEAGGVTVRCFGNFEVYLNGEPIRFRYNKTKELFAYLVDRRGAMCTNGELMAVLFEIRDNSNYFQKLRADLISCIPENVIVKQHGALGISTDNITCDYYDFLEGKPYAINAYIGEYMTQYSWAETTLAMLQNR